MALLLTRIKEAYNFVFYELEDERTRDMFPAAWVLIVLMPFYLYFTNSLGPRLMKNKQPFDLRSVIFYYNIFQIIFCGYIVYLFMIGGWLNGYSYLCQPVDWTENYKSRNSINAIWWYTVIKLIDLMDTVFFVLRKRDRQISFLHVFHHFGMPIVSFIGLKFYPNGHSTLLGALNSIVHIVMYTYYLIAGMGPKYQKYLWWKRYVTVLQIVQFVIICIHNGVASLNSNCDYPKWITVALTILSIQFIYLFGSFYYENYVKKQETKTNGKDICRKNEELKAH